MDIFDTIETKDVFDEISIEKDIFDQVQPDVGLIDKASKFVKDTFSRIKSPSFTKQYANPTIDLLTGEAIPQKSKEPELNPQLVENKPEFKIENGQLKIGENTEIAKKIRSTNILDEVVKFNKSFWKMNEKEWSAKINENDMLALPATILTAISKIGNILSPESEPVLGEQVATYKAVPNIVWRAGEQSLPLIYNRIKSLLSTKTTGKITEEIPSIVAEEIAKKVRPEDAIKIKQASPYMQQPRTELTAKELGAIGEFPEARRGIPKLQKGTPIPTKPEKVLTEKDFGELNLPKIEQTTNKQVYTKYTKRSEVFNEPVRLQEEHITDNIKNGSYTYNEYIADPKAYYDPKVAKLSSMQQDLLENRIKNKFSDRGIDKEVEKLIQKENARPEEPSKLDQLAEEWGITEQEKPILKAGKGLDKVSLDSYTVRRNQIADSIIQKHQNLPKKEIDELVRLIINKETFNYETGLEYLIRYQKKEAQSGAISFVKQERIKSTVPFDSSETEALYQSAKGIKEPNIIQKVKTAATKIGHKFTRVYEHLEQKTGKNAQIIFDLKRLEKARNTVADSTTRDIGEVLGKATREDYDIFNRKIILNDLKSDVEKGLYKNKELPFKLTPESLNKELTKLDEVIKTNPILQEILTKRQKMWDDFKPQYVEAMKPYKIGVEDMFKDNYYRHDVLDYVTNNGIFGTGKKLKTPQKGYMRERTGYSGLYNTDYLEAEHQILAQMKYDMEVAKTLTKIKKYEDISESLKGKDWKKNIPEGYRTWQPKEGSVFYPAMSLPENTAKQIMEDEILKIADVKDQLREVLAVGGKRPEWVVRDEVADTLDNLTRERTKGIISSADLGLMTAWKRWQLISPRRFFKYNTRNASGDAEAVFVGNASAFTKTPSATEELYDVFFRKQEMPPDMKAFFDRGGMSSTLQAQEMDDLKQLWMYSRLYDKKAGVQNIWKEYWNKARKFTDFRESILRYAAFKDFKEQLIKGNGIPKSYGASNPKMIDALKDINDKAFWLQNDLLGAYDMVSVAGQTIRERLIPFWSWQEVNFKRYLQLYKNAANDERLTVAIGKKLGATTPRIAFKMGSLAVKVAGLTSALAVYNNTMFPEEEAELSKDIKKFPHIVLGRDNEGRIQYFNRLGTLDDFTSWFGLDYTPQLINDYRKGNLTFKELLQEQGEKSLKAIPNKLTGQTIPITKLAYETATRRSISPDIFKPGTVRDRALNLARSFGLENEYTAMAGLPSRGYEDTLKDFFMYKIDPGEAAYRDVYDLKNEFLSKSGRTAEGFWLTPQGDAFYNMKLAVKYKDKKAFSKYFNIFADELKEQEKLGNIGNSIVGIVTGMNPLSGLNPIEQAKFMKGLDEEGKTKLDRAMKFYKETLSNIKGMDFKINAKDND